MLDSHSSLDRDLVDFDPSADGADLDVQKALLALVIRTMRLLVKQFELFIQGVAFLFHQFKQVV